MIRKEQVITLSPGIYDAQNTKVLFSSCNILC